MSQGNAQGCVAGARPCWLTGLLGQQTTERAAYAKEYEERINQIYGSSGLKRCVAPFNNGPVYKAH